MHHRSSPQKTEETSLIHARQLRTETTNLLNLIISNLFVSQARIQLPFVDQQKMTSNNRQLGPPLYLQTVKQLRTHLLRWNATHISYPSCMCIASLAGPITLHQKKSQINSSRETFICISFLQQRLTQEHNFNPD